MTVDALRQEMKDLADPQKAAILQRFFKTGPGQYGEGDRFWGVKVPLVRKLAKKYRHLLPSELEILLSSSKHEERQLALFVLVLQFTKADPAQQEKIYRFYLDHRSGINNWDLVDGSAPYIVGPYLLERDKSVLYNLVRSENLWQRRIAIMATFYFIRQNHFEDALALSEILLNDTHDLIHKAVGWMLREIGKRDLQSEENFLKPRYQTMPRTMLRYAIEKFPEAKRLAYLKGRV